MQEALAEEDDYVCWGPGTEAAARSFPGAMRVRIRAGRVRELVRSQGRKDKAFGARPRARPGPAHLGVLQS